MLQHADDDRKGRGDVGGFGRVRSLSAGRRRLSFYGQLWEDEFGRGLHRLGADGTRRAYRNGSHLYLAFRVDGRWHELPPIKLRARPTPNPYVLLTDADDGGAVVRLGDNQSVRWHFTLDEARKHPMLLDVLRPAGVWRRNWDQGKEGDGAVVLLSRAVYALFGAQPIPWEVADPASWEMHHQDGNTQHDAIENLLPYQRWHHRELHRFLDFPRVDPELGELRAVAALWALDQMDEHQHRIWAQVQDKLIGALGDWSDLADLDTPAAASTMAVEAPSASGVAAALCAVPLRPSTSPGRVGALYVVVDGQGFGHVDGLYPNVGPVVGDLAGTHGGCGCWCECGERDNPDNTAFSRVSRLRRVVPSWRSAWSGRAPP